MFSKLWRPAAATTIALALGAGVPVAVSAPASAQARKCTRNITINRYVAETIANFISRCAHSGQVGADWNGVMTWSTKSTGAAAVTNEPTSLPAVKADCVVVALYNSAGTQVWRKVMYHASGVTC